jgi:hypothetical protein
MGRFAIAIGGSVARRWAARSERRLTMNPKAMLLIGAATMTLAALGPVTTALADGYPTRVTPIAKAAPKPVAPRPAPKPVVRTRIKIVERPVYVEKIVKQPVYIEKRTEVPVDRIVYVERPVDRVVEKRVEVPVVKIVEKPVDRPVYVDRPVDRIIEKRVEVPVDRIVEKRVEVPVEKIVRVPVYVEHEERRVERRGCDCDSGGRVYEDRGYREQGRAYDRAESSVERSEETYESESSRYSEEGQGWSYQGSYMAGDGYAQSLEGGGRRGLLRLIQRALRRRRRLDRRPGLWPVGLCPRLVRRRCVLQRPGRQRQRLDQRDGVGRRSLWRRRTWRWRFHGRSRRLLRALTAFAQKPAFTERNRAVLHSLASGIGHQSSTGDHVRRRAAWSGVDRGLDPGGHQTLRLVRRTPGADLVAPFQPGGRLQGRPRLCQRAVRGGRPDAGHDKARGPFLRRRDGGIGRLINTIEGDAVRRIRHPENA